MYRCFTTDLSAWRWQTNNAYILQVITMFIGAKKVNPTDRDILIFNGLAGKIKPEPPMIW